MSRAIDGKKHLNRAEVLKTLEALKYPPQNIVSTVNIAGFDGVEIFTSTALLRAVSDVVDKKKDLILFRVGAQSKGFVGAEGENNHYVALHFAQDESGLKLTYIDPTGAEISPEIMDILRSHPSLKDCPIASSGASLQYTNPTLKGVEPYQMRGNDYDCGVFVALASDMVRRNHKERDKVKLAEVSSKRLGQTLRQLTRGEKTLDDIGEAIERALHIDMEDEAPLLDMSKKKNSEWKLEIHQLDIGQGDSALILFKKRNAADGKYEVVKAIMIDGGRPTEYEYLLKYLANKVGADQEARILDLHRQKEELAKLEERIIALKKKTYEERNYKDPSQSPAKKNEAEIARNEQRARGMKNDIRDLEAALLDEGLKKLDAIIITHDDLDHVGGISRILRREDIFIGPNTKFIIQAGKQGGDDAIYQNIARYVTKGIDDAAEKDVAKKTNIIFAYNKIGRSIWEVFDIAKPDGAPDVEFLASDGSFRGDVALDLHDQRNRVDMAKMEDDNSGSIVSLIKMDNFRYYTAGDFETNRNLIEYLQLKEQALNAQVKYLPIQAFLVPHHGSRENFPGAKAKNPMFVNAIKARAAVISAGGTTYYGHPHKETTDTLEASDTSFVYTTNASDHQTSAKFVVPTRDDIAERKGTIKVQTYQNIAADGQEKFMVKYRGKSSKTRDYFKDKDFNLLKTDFLAVIEGFYGDQEDLKSGRVVKLYLSLDDLKFFKSEGEDRNIKHLNPTTLKKFFEDYEEDDDRDYIMSFSIKEDLISFSISSNSFHDQKQQKIRLCLSAEKASELFAQIKDLKQTIGGGEDKSFGLFLSQDEMDNFQKNGGLTALVKARMKESKDEASKKSASKNCFLEIHPPQKDSKEIVTSSWKRQEEILLKKEYHKDKERNPSTGVHKVIARRVEYGTKKDRSLF